MKESTTNGSILSCGWLPPVIAMDPAFIELFAGVPGPYVLLATLPHEAFAGLD